MRGARKSGLRNYYPFHKIKAAKDKIKTPKGSQAQCEEVLISAKLRAVPCDQCQVSACPELRVGNL